MYYCDIYFYLTIEVKEERRTFVIFIVETINKFLI